MIVDATAPGIVRKPVTTFRNTITPASGVIPLTLVANGANIQEWKTAALATVVSIAATGAVSMASTLAVTGNITGSARVSVGTDLRLVVNGISTLFTNDNHSHIYSTTSTGSYPFDGQGNLVIQTRSDASRDIVFMTGSGTPTVAMIIGEQNGTRITMNRAVTMSSTLAVTGAFTGSGNWLYTQTDHQVLATTNTQRITIAGGSTTGSASGASILLAGVSHANTGLLQLNAGNVTGSTLNLLTGGTTRLSIPLSGNITMTPASGTFALTGAQTISSTLTVTGNTTINGNLWGSKLASVGSGGIFPDVQLMVSASSTSGISGSGWTGLRVDTTSISTVSTENVGVLINTNTDGGTFTLDVMRGMYVNMQKGGAGVTINFAYGLYIGSVSVANTAANNYAIYTNAGLVQLTGATTIGDNIAGSTFNIAGKAGVTNTYTFETTSTNGTLNITIGSGIDRFVSFTNSGLGNLNISTDGKFTNNTSLVDAIYNANSAVGTATFFTAKDTTTFVRFMYSPGSVAYNYFQRSIMVGQEDVATISSNGALLDVRRDSTSAVIAAFGGTTALSADYPGYIYFSQISTINFGYNRNANAAGYINYVGYQNGTSQFRDLIIANGKSTQIASFIGASGSLIIGSASSSSYKLDVTGTSYFSGAITIESDVTIRANGTSTLNLITAHNTATNRPQFLMKRSRGSIGSESNVADGDSIGSIVGQAYSGGFYSTAEIDFYVDGTFTGGQRPPSRIEFYTNSANASQALSMRINQGGETVFFRGGSYHAQTYTQFDGVASGVGSSGGTTNARMGWSTTTAFIFQTQGNLCYTVTASNGTITFAGQVVPSQDIVFTGSSTTIRTDTSDASDNKALSLTGGGAVGTGRGAYIQLFGNEFGGSNNGRMTLSAGNASPGDIVLATGAAPTIRLQISNAGAYTLSGLSGSVTTTVTVTSTGVLGRTAALTVNDSTGQVTMTTSGQNETAGLKLESTLPYVAWHETDAAANQGWWAMGANTSQFKFVMFNDAFGAITNIFTVDRSGATPTLLTLATYVTIGDKLTLAASTTTRASINIPLGVAPTTPAEGDIWRDSTNDRLLIRVGGATRRIQIVA